MTNSSDNKSQSQQVFELYLKAIEDGTFFEASKVVQAALEAQVPPEIIYDKVFTQSLRQVGLNWESNKMTVAQEHLATGITEYCRNLVLNSRLNSSAPKVGRVLLTSVVGNQHTLGLSLLSDVFKWRGWEVFPLFSALPPEEIAQAAQFYQADLVCLSVALPGQIAKTKESIQLLRGSGWKGIVEVGGAVFVQYPHLAREVGADFCGGDATETVEKATQMLNARAVN